MNSHFYTYWSFFQRFGEGGPGVYVTYGFGEDVWTTYKDVKVCLLDKKALQERFGLMGYEADELLEYMGQLWRMWIRSLRVNRIAKITRVTVIMDYVCLGFQLGLLVIRWG